MNNNCNDLYVLKFNVVSFLLWRRRSTRFQNQSAKVQQLGELFVEDIVILSAQPTTSLTIVHKVVCHPSWIIVVN